VNNEYCKCCFEVCLLVYLCIKKDKSKINPHNSKPSPRVQRLTTTFGHISPSKKDWHRGSPLEEELCHISLKHHWTCPWCCWKALGESDLRE
jgi:hypothetical protein